MFENPRRGRQATNLTKNDPEILDLKSSSEQIIFRKLSLGAPDFLQRLWFCYSGPTGQLLATSVPVPSNSPTSLKPVNSIPFPYSFLSGEL